MNVYECNENQFVENIRRLVDSNNKIIVNRRITLYDDQKYGLSTLPDKEFESYSMIAYRNGYKRTVYSKVPFIDEYHNHLYKENEVLHSASNLLFPRLFIPYYKVEYSFNIWGNMYLHSFDLLFKSEIKLEKRKIQGNNLLVHILRFIAPDERIMMLKLPEQVIILDVKKLTRIFE